MPINVLGEELQICSMNPRTGWFRDGCCNTDGNDDGVHTVCVVMTEEFLEFSASKGNDLSTPQPEFGFVGLKEGDRWCLCAPRWAEALEEGMAPKVVLAATHARTLDWCEMADLKRYAIDDPDNSAAGNPDADDPETADNSDDDSNGVADGA